MGLCNLGRRPQAGRSSRVGGRKLGTEGASSPRVAIPTNVGCEVWRKSPKSNMGSGFHSSCAPPNGAFGTGSPIAMLTNGYCPSHCPSLALFEQPPSKSPLANRAILFNSMAGRVRVCISVSWLLAIISRLAAINLSARSPWPRIGMNPIENRDARCEMLLSSHSPALPTNTTN